MAAHRILMADMGTSELACPGGRRSHAIDVIAGIIKDVFELAPEDRFQGRDLKVESARIGGRLLLELPQRIGS